MDNKQKSAGSLYFNINKDATPAEKNKLGAMMKEMQGMGVTFSISIKAEGGNYAKYNAIFSKFRKKPTDPHVVLFEREAGAGAPQGSYRKSEHQASDEPPLF